MTAATTGGPADATRWARAGASAAAARRRALATLAALAIAATALAGCGDPDAGEVVFDATVGLAAVNSGEMSLEVVAEAPGARRGFAIAGPVAFPASGDGLPEAELRYLQVTDDARERAQFVATGGRAWRVEGDEAVPLTAAQQRRLAGLAAGAASGLRDLQLDRWFVEPVLEDGPTLGGAETYEIRGGLDVAAVLRDLGSPLAADADAVARATRSARVEMLAHREDRALRRLQLAVRLRQDVPERLRRALGGLSGASLRLKFELVAPNSEVRVSAPSPAKAAK